MQATRLAIPDVVLLTPQVYGDARGYFFESFNERVFEKVIGFKRPFVQDNQARSRLGVLRGLHYQVAPNAQAKLVRVLVGEVFDVAVDIRKSSPHFGRWVGERLSAENKKQLWIPEGFAHGYVALSETADVFYKTTNYYSPEHDRCILWSDNSLAIQWPTAGVPLLVSPRDQQGAAFASAELFK